MSPFSPQSPAKKNEVESADRYLRGNVILFLSFLGKTGVCVRNSAECVHRNWKIGRRGKRERETRN